MENINTSPDIPCRQCPSLALCLHRDNLKCNIILKYVVNLYEHGDYDYEDFQITSQPFCDLFNVYGFIYDKALGVVSLSGRRLHE